MVTLTPPLTFLPTDRAPTGGTFTDCSLYRNPASNNTLAAGCHLSAWHGEEYVRLGLSTSCHCEETKKLSWSDNGHSRVYFNNRVKKNCG